MSRITQYSVPTCPVPWRLTLRAGRLVYFHERAVVIGDAEGVRTLAADWEVEQCELSANGRFVAALGDDGRRATVWDTANGDRLLDAIGVESRRQSLRVGLAALGSEPFALVAPWNKPISIVTLDCGTERLRLATTALVWFHAVRFVELDAQSVAVQGHLDGEQFDSILAIPIARVLADIDALQVAFVEPASVREWGYRITVGPAGNGRAVFYRDPEWGDDDPPDDPAESFSGFVIWNLTTGRVEQRIAYDGEVASGAQIGADAERVVVASGRNVDVVERGSGKVRHIERVVFDPYRLEVARLDAGTVKIEML